ncbi:MAG: hypothetical protein JWM16_4330 [Verrucomicrobiales bacterium]|nr:hypothetical protein [Verrucomicrobiales bacterium]
MRIKTRAFLFGVLAGCILLYKAAGSIARTNYVSAANRITSGQKSYKGIIVRESDDVADRLLITGNIETKAYFTAFLLELQRHGKKILPIETIHGV